MLIRALAALGAIYGQRSSQYADTAGTIFPDTLLPSYHLRGTSAIAMAASQLSTAAYIRNAVQGQYYTGADRNLLDHAHDLRMFGHEGQRESLIKQTFGR